VKDKHEHSSECSVKEMEECKDITHKDVTVNGMHTFKEETAKRFDDIERMQVHRATVPRHAIPPGMQVRAGGGRTGRQVWGVGAGADAADARRADGRAGTALLHHATHYHVAVPTVD
jgi:hypothetical protein